MNKIIVSVVCFVIILTFVALTGCMTLKDDTTFYSERHDIEYTYYNHKGAGFDTPYVFKKGE